MLTRTPLARARATIAVLAVIALPVGGADAPVGNEPAQSYESSNRAAQLVGIPVAARQLSAAAGSNVIVPDPIAVTTSSRVR